MKVRTTQRCPHCDKPIGVREIQLDKASKEELTTFFKEIMSVK